MLSKGDRDLLLLQNRDGSTSGGWVLLACSLVLLGASCFICSMPVEEMPKAPAVSTISMPGPSMRPTLEPRDKRFSQTSTPKHPPSREDRTSTTAAGRKYTTQLYCTHLIVPRGTQSTFGIPHLASANDSSPVVFVDVVDPIGMPILKAELNLTRGSVNRENVVPPMREPVIVLRDLTPETRAPLLSSPKAGFDGTSALALVYKCGNDMEICMPDNSIFARLQEEYAEGSAEPQYALKTGADEIVSMIFTGKVDDLTVIDPQNRVWAKTQNAKFQFEAERKFYSIRVASGVDAGVLLCCILFIDGRNQGFF